MKYQFILSYKATDSETVMTNTCHPVYGDDLSVTIDREDGEWYYKRKLDGKITFERDDYRWIMARPFDGTFTLTVNETHDSGASWHPYFEGTFSRANLEIDEDNQSASLSSFIEGVYNAIENGKNEDYDLMKIIPDSDAKEVQGQVHPALAMVDYRSTNIDTSDMFCGSAIVSDGYKEKVETGYSEDNKITSDSDWNFIGIYAEARVKMKSSHPEASGIYSGVLQYSTRWSNYFIPVGTLDCNNGSRIVIDAYVDNEEPGHPISKRRIRVFDPNNVEVDEELDVLAIAKQSPSSVKYDYTESSGYWLDKMEIFFHYIRATLLTQDGGNSDNVLDTGAYYKRMAAFVNDGGLQIYASSNTTDQPNGHRLITGTGEQGTTPQYFAPPDDQHDYIPLAEDNWNYGSLWYTITPSVANGLLDETKIGSFRWTRCWTIGTVLRYLLDRITDGKVVFTEDTTSSQFLYSTVNPVNQHEPFDYLITQKSNVMNPGGGDAQRCPVRLQWFLELLRNAFCCYYWLEKRNDGKYLFRVEHVEYFRRGGHYDGTLPAGIDITTLKPRRNFRNQLNQLAKTYADQTNKYAYNMQNMVEKYTFSWQGDGGSDAFKGNPMFFKAGWIEKSSSEDHQVDNIFADLAWLMLNSGTDTASSKNYDGVFLFSGYRPYDTSIWKENSEAQGQYLVLATATSFNIACDIWLTVPAGETVMVKYERVENPVSIPVQSLVGTGHPQQISINERRSFNTDYRLMVQLPNDYSDVTIHRIHACSGNVFNVPNVTNLLRPTNYLQNGVLAWPWLQCEHLHYDIPANKWCYKHDNLQDITTEDWEADGTVKMIQKQTVKPVPITDKGTEDSIMDITGIHTSIEGGKTGIITNAKINLSSRNAELTIVYDPIPPQQ